jgi:hypothetical protein
LGQTPASAATIKARHHTPGVTQSSLAATCPASVRPPSVLSPPSAQFENLACDVSPGLMLLAIKRENLAS